jgi:hypothetical protein
MIRLFKVFYWIVVILQIIVSVALLITLGVKRSVIIDNCSLKYSADSCNSTYRNVMIALSCVLVVWNIIQVPKPNIFKPHTPALILKISLYRSTSPQLSALTLPACVEQPCTKSFEILRTSLSLRLSQSSFKFF